MTPQAFGDLLHRRKPTAEGFGAPRLKTGPLLAAARADGPPIGPGLAVHLQEGAVQAVIPCPRSPTGDCDSAAGSMPISQMHTREKELPSAHSAAIVTHRFC